jgi:MoaA/NifB/PqqE/SkfB family radical SAM enzyme
MTSDSSHVQLVRASKHRLWKNRSPMLSRLDMELTERCNNNRIHCCINQAEDYAAREREISTEDAKRIPNEAASLGCLSVRFTGGEPLLREDFEELYPFARRLGLKVLIFTNARLINPEMVDLLVKVPPLEKVEVTVYGMSRESYEAVSRIKSSYDEFRRGINLLLDRKIPFAVKGALLPPNRGEMTSSKLGPRPFRGWTRRPAIPCSSTCAAAGILQLRIRRLSS